MDDLLERLQRRSWRLTPQRQAVVEALQGVNVHLSADEVLDRVRATLPDTSRATVYNTLNELVDLGEVGELHVAGRSRTYDPNLADEHHHLLCEQCGMLRDVRLGAVTPPVLPEGLDGFDVRRHAVLFTGVCASCQVDR